jgi:hypothetical protein
MDQSIAQPGVPETNRPMKINNLSLKVKVWGKRWDVIRNYNLQEFSSPSVSAFHWKRQRKGPPFTIGINQVQESHPIVASQEPKNRRLVCIS